MKKGFKTASLILVLIFTCTSLLACNKNDEQKSVSALGYTTITKEAENPSNSVELAVVRAGAIVASGQNSLNFGELKAGDLIYATADYQYISVALFSALGESLVYSPTGEFVFKIPSDAAAYKAGAFSQGANLFSARIAKKEDLVKRNLAHNAYDFMYLSEVNRYDAPSGTLPSSSLAVENNEVVAFPHAYANRVTENRAIFHARNAIDGIAQTDGHAAHPYQSWGCGLYDDGEFTLYFGREVTLEQLSFVLRADYSGSPAHDTHWEQISAEFSNGTQKVIDLVGGGEMQSVALSKVKTTFVRLTQLSRAKTNSQMFAALTELEAIGTDTTKNPLASKSTVSSSFGAKPVSVKTSAYRANDIKQVIDDAHNYAANLSGILADSNWQNGVYYSSLLDAYAVTGTADQYLFARTAAEKFGYQITATKPNGRPLSSLISGYSGGGSVSDFADNYIISEAYLALNEYKGSEQKTFNTFANAEANMAVAPSWSPNFNGGGEVLDFWWCDAIYMGLNTYTLMSRITGDSSYQQKAFLSYEHWKGQLYNSQYNLWHRDLERKPNKNSGSGLPEFWARGNAWVIAALAKQLLYITDTSSQMYQTYLSDFKLMAESIKQYQREDGTWNTSIIDPNFYQGAESTGTSGFLYAFAVGVSLGILSYDEYFPIISKAYDALTGFCMEAGYLGYMQGVGYQPQSYISEQHTKPLANSFGYGLFLSAASMLMRMCEDFKVPAVTVFADCITA